MDSGDEGTYVYLATRHCFIVMWEVRPYVCVYVCVCVCACVCVVDELGVNSVPSTVSPCSTHSLPSGQWTKVWGLCVHNWPVNVLSSAVLVHWFG